MEMYYAVDDCEEHYIKMLIKIWRVLKTQLIWTFQTSLRVRGTSKSYDRENFYKIAMCSIGPHSPAK